MPRQATLLVTGFGPFPRMPRNPSAALARAIAASPRLRLHGIAARAYVLTTAYATLPGELDPLLAEEPDAAILIGVAGRSRKVRVEGRATSRRSTLFPDVRGDLPEAPLAKRTGSASMRRTGVNVLAARARIAGRGLPVRLSRDPGRYLCNAAYFRALARARPTLFIHIPKEPRARPERRRGDGPVGADWRAALARALVDVAIGMVREARRVAARPTLS